MSDNIDLPPTIIIYDLSNGKQYLEMFVTINDKETKAVFYLQQGVPKFIYSTWNARETLVNSRSTDKTSLEFICGSARAEWITTNPLYYDIVNSAVLELDMAVLSGEL